MTHHNLKKFSLFYAQKHVSILIQRPRFNNTTHETIP